MFFRWEPNQMLQFLHGFHIARTKFEITSTEQPIADGRTHDIRVYMVSPWFPFYRFILWNDIRVFDASIYTWNAQRLLHQFFRGHGLPMFRPIAKSSPVGPQMVPCTVYLPSICQGHPVHRPKSFWIHPRNSNRFSIPVVNKVAHF